MKPLVVFLSESRADWWLLKPIVSELEGRGRVRVFVLHFNVFHPSLGGSVESMKPALVVSPCDRREVVKLSVDLYYRHLNLVHFHAGDVSKHGSLDDWARWSLTMMARAHLCNGRKAAGRVKRILREAGREEILVFNIGTTAFDYEPDYSLCPSEPYDLVLYNPPTRRLKDVEADLEKIRKLLKRTTVWIHPNVDEGSDYIVAWIRSLKRNSHLEIIDFEEVDHPCFLGLMERCRSMIGNSSAMFLEAPFLGVKTIHVGVRDSGRETPEFRPGGGKRGAKVLEWLARRWATEV